MPRSIHEPGMLMLVNRPECDPLESILLRAIDGVSVLGR
jgi:hypothetical protein